MTSIATQDTDTLTRWQELLTSGKSATLTGYLREVSKAGSMPDADAECIVKVASTLARNSTVASATAALLWSESGRPQAELAQALGVTPGRISQMVTAGRVFATVGIPGSLTPGQIGDAVSAKSGEIRKALALPKATQRTAEVQRIVGQVLSAKADAKAQAASDKAARVSSAGEGVNGKAAGKASSEVPAKGSAKVPEVTVSRSEQVRRYKDAHAALLPFLGVCTPAELKRVNDLAVAMVAAVEVASDAQADASK